MSKNQMAKCPFNEYHTISKEKLLNHIRKCKEKQFSNLVQCKYSELHWININDIHTHQQGCNESFASLHTYEIENQLKSSQQNSRKNKQQDPFHPFLDQISMIIPPQVKKENVVKVGKVGKNVKKSKKQDKPQLWKQPNFVEWLDQQMSKAKKKEKDNSNFQTSNMIDQSHYDLDFGF